MMFVLSLFYRGQQGRGISFLQSLALLFNYLDISHFPSCWRSLRLCTEGVRVFFLHVHRHGTEANTKTVRR